MSAASVVPSVCLASVWVLLCGQQAVRLQAEDSGHCIICGCEALPACDWDCWADNGVVEGCESSHESLRVRMGMGKLHGRAHAIA